MLRYISRTYPALLHGAAILLVLIGWFLMGGPVHPAHAELRLESGLLVSTRSRFRMCMTMTPALTKSEAKVSAKLIKALNVVRQHKDWERADLGQSVPQLERSCPARIPTSRLAKGDVMAVGPGITDNPGVFRTVLVVLDDAQADTVIGTSIAALVPYELMRTDDDNVAEVTSALVVRESALEDPVFVTQYLPLSIGLDPATPFTRPSTEHPTK